MTTPSILLTFDVEEFDLPLEYKQDIPLEEQLDIGYKGLQEIAELLYQPSIATTLFTTAVFAENQASAIKNLSEKHEIASHTYSHTIYRSGDLSLSREKLEKIIGKKVMGLRMPRMRWIDPDSVRKAGYLYNSSINPTWIPGRYNNFNKPRTPFREQWLLQFPVSVTPTLRIPLFWLSFKNMPYSFYRKLVLQTLRRDKYVCLYFHPWEFINLSQYKLPSYIKKGSDKSLLKKLKQLITDLSNEGEFATMNDYIKGINL